ncbi:MAG: hypothetical protein ACI9LM_004488 [Alteromonadaceae bacterium]
MLGIKGDIVSIELIIGGAGSALTLYQIIKDSNGFLIGPKKDEFLNYDPSYLLGLYSSEKPISPSIPYCEIVSLFPTMPMVKISIRKEQYINTSENQEWNQVSSIGYSKLLESKRVKDNEEAIRLANCTNDSCNLLLTLQKARYHDQCRSNLILDYSSKDDLDSISLRNMLKLEYGRQLPPLTDTRLANTVGIAALLFYKNNNEYIPYMVKRVKKVGVFPGGVHCTSSGVAKWPQHQNSTFDECFTEHMYLELEEEVGIKKEDIVEFMPISICREFGRGGKPQIFYAGITSLTKDELVAKRKVAAKVIKDTNLWPEIEQTKWHHSEIVLDAKTLSESINKYKVTLEGVAALHFGLKYLQQHVKYNAK